MKKYLIRLVFTGIPIVLCFFTLLVLSSCSKKNDNNNELIMKNGLLYKPGSDVPYTGQEKASLRSRIIEYDVVNGVKQGEMKISFMNGKPQIIGQMIKNKNVGHWKYFYETQQVESEGDFKDDMPDGLWTWYFPAGNVREQGNYDSGRRTGKWITYDSSGKITVVKLFKNGELVKK